VAVAATALVLTVVKRAAPSRGAGGRGRRFDWPGASLSSAALITFLLGMTNAYRYGWSSPIIVVALGLAVLLLATFIWWELRTGDPMLDMGLFRNKVFSMGISARSVSFLGGSAVFFLMPFYLMQALGYQASQAAFMMVPGSIGMAVMGLISGRLSDLVGTRWPSAVGMASSAAGMFLFSRMGVDAHPAHVATGMALTGLGMGLFSAATTSAVMGSMARSRYGIATAFVNLARTSSNVTGVAMATTIVTLTMGSLGYEPSLAAVTEDGGEGVKVAFVSGMSRAFMVAGALMALSILRGEPQPEENPAEPAVAEPRAMTEKVASS
jgi:MFS family permease